MKLPDWLTGSEEQKTPEANPVQAKKAEKEVELRASQHTEFLKRSYDAVDASVDRYKGASTAVQTLATALGAIYTGALALVFGKDAGGLPARGLLTPGFFAIALVLSLLYTASIKPEWRKVSRPPLWADSAEFGGFEKLDAYRRLVAELVTRKIGSLQGSVVALGLAVAFAPAPFVRASSKAAATTPWPTPLPTATSGAELEVFKAQLKEVADRRAAELKAPSEFYLPAWDLPWLVAAGVSFALLLVWVRLVTNRERKPFVTGV